MIEIASSTELISFNKYAGCLKNTMDLVSMHMLQYSEASKTCNGLCKLENWVHQPSQQLESKISLYYASSQTSWWLDGQKALSGRLFQMIMRTQFGRHPFVVGKIKGFWLVAPSPPLQQTDAAAPTQEMLSHESISLT